jgi:hypothetical protein
VDIETVTFEFPYSDAPLSWHLTRSEKQRIQEAWENTPNIKAGKDRVCNYLNGKARGAS